MSKNFEEEYKEYLNAQAPDLWDRIEAGVDAMVGADAEKVVPISAAKSNKAKKKRRIRYQNYRMLVSVAACLFALVLIVPVYLLMGPSGKSSDNAASEAPVQLTDATIQNIEVASEDCDDAIEESAPMEDAMEDVAEVEIALEEMEGVVTELAQATEETADGQSQYIGKNDGQVLGAGDGENGGQVAKGEAVVTGGTDISSEAAGEDSLPAQEEMQVTILGKGTAQEDGVMYTAAVVGNTSSATIGLLVPTGSDIVLEADKTYTVTVQMSEDGAHYVVVDATVAE